MQRVDLKKYLKLLCYLIYILDVYYLFRSHQLKNVSDENYVNKDSETVNCRNHCAISNHAHMGTGSCFSFLKPLPPVLMSSMLAGNELNLLGETQMNNVPLFIRISLVLQL